MADVSDLIDPFGKPLKPQKHKHDEHPASDEVKKEEHVDYKDRYLRALADYKNLQRQVEKERQLIFTLATANVLERIIPTVDMLYTAEVFIKDPGMQMVKDQLVRVLDEFGLKEIELLGKAYDPHTAEVVGTVEGGDEGVVVEVVRRAYMMGDKVIRVGQVKVGESHAGQKG